MCSSDKPYLSAQSRTFLSAFSNVPHGAPIPPSFCHALTLANRMFALSSPMVGEYRPKPTSIRAPPFSQTMRPSNAPEPVAKVHTPSEFAHASRSPSVISSISTANP